MNKFENMFISLQARPKNVRVHDFFSCPSNSDEKLVLDFEKELIKEIFLLFKNEFILSNLNAIEVFFILKFGSFKSELFES